MTVGRICVRQVDLADLDETVDTAAVRMLQRGVGTLVVVDEARCVLGLITDRDLMERVVAQGLDPRETRVGDVMTIEPTTISEQEPIESALERMQSGPYRRLPVVGGDNELVGILSLDDVLVLLSEELTTVGRILRSETPRGVADSTTNL